MKNKNLCVAIHGSYFGDNFGDTLLVKLMCDRVSRIVGRENVFLAIDGGRQEQKDIGYPVLQKSLRANATHLIYCGGGYLGERTSKLIPNLYWSFRNYMRHFVWRKQYKNARTAIIGVGFGPVSNLIYRLAAIRLIKNSEIVLFRDSESTSFFRQYSDNRMHVDECVDMALSLESPSSCNLHFRPIAVHIDNLLKEEISIIFESIKKRKIFGNNVDVIYDNLHAESPTSRAKYLDASKNFDLKINFISYKNYSDLVKKITEYRLIVTSKLHVGIVGVSQGVRIISIPTHQKTIRLYRQLNIDNFCLDRKKLCFNDVYRALDPSIKFEPNKQAIDLGIGKIEAAIQNFLS